MPEEVVGRQIWAVGLPLPDILSWGCFVGSESGGQRAVLLLEMCFNRFYPDAPNDRAALRRPQRTKTAVATMVMPTTMKPAVTSFSCHG